MPGTKKCATHVDIARACMRKCALAVPVCVCDLLYVCVLTWEFARSLLCTRVNVSLDPDSVSDADSIFQTQRTNWKTKQTLPPRKCFICLPHTNKQQRTQTHTHTHLRRCQGDTPKCTAISAPNSFRWQRVFPDFATAFFCVHTNFAASFSCYNITKKYMYKQDEVSVCLRLSWLLK